MPYIDQKARETVAWFGPSTPGELNYAVTQLIEDYRSLKGDSYQTFNDVVGALEGAKLELYRRVVAPYEDAKKEQNGDVYYPGQRILENNESEIRAPQTGVDTVSGLRRTRHRSSRV